VYAHSLIYGAKMKTDLKEKIEQLIAAPLIERGVDIADISISHYKNNSTIRLFVYTEKGATLGECADISRLVGDLIEETDFFENGYLLEVSSPGLDRPLTELKDFRYRIGEKIKLAFIDKKRKKITVEIKSVHDNTIIFSDMENDISVDITEIENGKIIF